MAASRYLLDTNILSELIRDPQGPVTQRIATLDDGAICTSIVVAGELRYGAARRGSPTLTGRVEQLLEHVEVLALDEAADRHYAEIRNDLEREGRVIGANDLWIAAHARSLDHILVTRNLREFERVPGLQIESWGD